MAGVDFMIRLKVQEVAARKKMSMRKLAKNADIAYNTLRTIYRDPYRSISTDTLDKLAEVLGVDASELIESVNKNKNVPGEESLHTKSSE
ncbi:MAG TPA: helix-turn-helix transcriptional regulator [Ktedonobacteraceae bacterium]|nr:helix-turn-helix transcriptional regulator [Ktedonobacteraceae bacterium]